MTREDAAKLAVEAAKLNPPSYLTEDFKPHEWVVDAVLAAYKKGLADQADRDHWGPGW